MTKKELEKKLRQYEAAFWLIAERRMYACIEGEIPFVNLRKERKEILLALEHLEKLDDNWNGYGAKKTLKFVIDTAKCFFEHLPQNRKCPDKISPDGEGGVIFKWGFEENALLLSFEPGLIHLSCRSLDKPTVYCDDIIYQMESDTKIPQDILKYIPTR